jgi:hypothetical protein
VLGQKPASASVFRALNAIASKGETSTAPESQRQTGAGECPGNGSKPGAFAIVATGFLPAAGILGEAADEKALGDRG